MINRFKTGLLAASFMIACVTPVLTSFEDASDAVSTEDNAALQSSNVKPQISTVSEFRTAEIARLCQKLSVAPSALPVGVSHITAKGNKITVSVNAAHVVDHVGLTLFSDEMKSAGDRMTLNFLERYFLELRYPKQETVEYKLRDDNVKFLVGGPATAASITPDDAFSLQGDEKRQTASWTRGGKTILSLSFPTEYSLLSGEDKEEAEKLLENDLRSFAFNPPLPSDSVKPDINSLEPTTVPQYYILRGPTCYSKKVSSNLYYMQDNGGQLSLVADPTHLAESCANLMISTAVKGDYTLAVNQNIYGFNSKEFNVSLSRWIAFCKRNGCEMFFGLENISGGVVKGMVLAVNKSANYNHLLSVEIPVSVIDNGGGVIGAELYSYVPTHNISDLFVKIGKRNKR